MPGETHVCNEAQASTAHCRPLLSLCPLAPVTVNQILSRITPKHVEEKPQDCGESIQERGGMCIDMTFRDEGMI